MSKWIAGMAAVAVVAVVVAARFGGDAGGEPAARPTVASASPTASADAGVADFTADSLLDLGLAAQAAEDFVRLWSLPQPGGDHDDWYQRLDGLVTDSLGRGLQVTDLDELPGLDVSSVTPPDVRVVSTSQAVVVVTLSDGSEIACTVVIYGPGYAVSSFAGVDGD